MNFQVKITEYAKKDLEIAYKFYETQKEGLGNYFIEIILSEIKMLEFYGCLHQKVFGFHRMISKKFPFGIYYDCDKKEKIIYIVGILDLRKNPNSLQKDLQKRK